MLLAGKVIEIVLSDALVVLLDNGEERKVHLSSIRLPRYSIFTIFSFISP